MTLTRIKDFIHIQLWMLLRGRKYLQQYRATASRRARLRLHDSWETLDEILRTGASVSRFGDGELQIMQRYLDELEHPSCAEEVDTFQHYDASLGKRLYEVWQVPSSARHLNCVPYAFKDSSPHRGYGRIFFEREALMRLPLLEKLALEHDFYDTNFTRFYMGRYDIRDYPAYIERMKTIWHDRDILFIEGEKSRLGVGNDLFSGARSVQRILCPATDAWGSYPEILRLAKEHGAGRLILIALGQTATVLAYDLSEAGLQAIDLGHVDVEYEWYRMRAKTKVPIPGKYVNEARGGREVAEHPAQATYLQQVVARVGEAKPTPTAALTTAVYPIEGLSCGHCVARATEALQTVAGVSSVTISLEAGEASVTYDAEHCTPEALRAAVEAAGYTLRIDEPTA